MKFTAQKFCPIMKELCAEIYCGLWDTESERCSILSIGLGANNLEDMKQDLYWIRRAVEDNQ